MGHSIFVLTEEKPMTKGFRWEGNTFVHVKKVYMRPKFSSAWWESGLMAFWVWECDLCEEEDSSTVHQEALDSAQRHASEHASRYRRPMAYS